MYKTWLTFQTAFCPVKWLTLHVYIQTISCCHLVAALGYCLWRLAWLWATGVCSCCHFQGCVLEAKRPGAFLWFFALNQYCMHCMLIMFHCSKISCNLHVTAEGELGSKWGYYCDFSFQQISFSQENLYKENSHNEEGTVISGISQGFKFVYVWFRA